MTTISNILAEIAHRPFELPNGQWKYYQEWNNALFMHWKVSVEDLRNCLPANLTIDTFEGHAYISLVAFTMQKIRPKYLPAIRFISDFDEINLRTYIINEGKPGVYFMNIEAGNSVSVFIAKFLSGLPYKKSTIKRTAGKYESTNAIKKFHLNTEFEIKDKLAIKTERDKWLIERYCLYLDSNEDSFRYDIHHKEWEIREVAIKRLTLNYTFGNISLSGRRPDFVHYSNGVKVIAWGRRKI